ncbi:MAG: hypothetical protein BM557_02835 [Flavobacterium sp. MedPE-SWcel]|uniref:glycosyltransferase family 117 protein n=1 Tax=uncultured Flavobacterium sp. TaxID=165435 RepID=UPI00091D4F3E|nr:DUF2723 domain-containing protein [uncultured Flavobacterium sp.]OIQ21748.1 MAG: hypothetical protein BM557_02835 [Flavobacterium sp. MedPE-SWcel]
MQSFSFKKWNLIIGWAIFCVAFIVYTLTVEPSVSFWDSGEYIATSAKLQVGHPPGAPLFQIIGAFFAMFANGKENVAFMVNMVSVVSSAFTILFMFWSATILLKNFVSGFSSLTKQNNIMILGSAAIGSLAFVFSDSFWFNATETEVYAMASLFIALLLWAGLRWGEAMHLPNGNRWLLLISLLIGLSFGVHFLALLTIPSIGLIYYFKNYKTVTIKNFVIANIAIIGTLLFIFMLLIPYTLTLFSKVELIMVNSLNLPFNSGTIFMFLLFAGLFYTGLRYTRKKQLPLYNTMLLCLLFIFTGFSTWILLPVRANSNIVINENAPTDATELLAYYNREQYGEQKLFYGGMYTEMYSGLDKKTPYVDAKPNYERDYNTGKYVIVNDYKNATQNLDENHKGYLPRMVHEKNAANYMAYAGPPKFKIDPNYRFEEDLPYLGVDVSQLSEEDTARAASQLKDQLRNVITEFKSAYKKGEIDNDDYNSFLQSYKQYLVIDKPTLAQNLSFMANYQFGYMYWRYFMWNFAGRQNDVQGKGDILNGNWVSGIKAVDEMRLGSQEYLTQDMLGNKGRNTYYFIPLLLGLLGLVYHAKKDAKSFYILLTLFLFTSLAVKIFLNESPFEVRERDYVLVGSFYVFAIWIGFGVYALYDILQKYVQPKLIAPVVLGATLLTTPVLMASENWDDHDRSDRYTALAMAKAYLNSCDPNAILFTIGDNDTFPLWYAQEIEGIRTDVRIACSTYLPTDWYIDQMKKQAYDSTPLPISLMHEQYRDGTRDYMLHNPKTDERIDIKDFIAFLSLDNERAKLDMNNGQRIHYYPTNKIRIPVDKEQVIKNKVVAPQFYDSIVPYIDIDLPEVLYKHNLIMLDIISNTNWERPIYFSGGSPDDEDYAWLKDYLQLEGMTYKFVPIKTEMTEENPIDIGIVDSKKMYDSVMKWDWGNSNSPNVYHDPQTLRNSITFKRNLVRLSDTLIKEGSIEKATKVIDLALEKMPVDYYKTYFIDESLADGYYRVSKKQKARELLLHLAGKYQESLTYYKSLDPSIQNDLYYPIIRDIESYRGLLLVMKENNDMEFYNRHKKDFNRYNKMFARFERDNE